MGASGKDSGCLAARTAAAASARDADTQTHSCNCPSRLRGRAATAVAIVLTLLGGCATQRHVARPTQRPAEVRAHILQLLPPYAVDRAGWATDIAAAFAAQEIEPTTRNLCATLAVAEQESGFNANPVVPGLGRIARAEIDRRAADHHVPQLLVRAAMLLKSPNGQRYGDRIAAVHNERELSLIYEDLVGSVPLGRTLLGDDNPVRTGGPMQVSVDFAEQYARQHPYPYPVDDSIRHEVFSRRGGVYFGIAHLLGYNAHYERTLYRFADYNAGFFASRNAAFQKAITLASGIPLALDGDLVHYSAGLTSAPTSATELAVRTLAQRLDLSDAQIHRTLQQGESPDFAQSPLYQRLFALAERVERHPLPRAMLPGITLASPKITRTLTTAWFATRVDQRYQRCLAEAGPQR
jgi:hypothetical protein